jgi:hypothetical protein
VNFNEEVWLCQEEMERDLHGEGVREQGVVLGKDLKVRGEWAAAVRGQVLGATAFALTVEPGCPIREALRATTLVVLSAEQRW